MQKPFIKVLVLVLLVFLVLVGCTSTSQPQDEKEATEKEQVVKQDEPSGQTISDELYFRTDDGEGGVQVGVLLGALEYFEATQNQEAIESFDLENNLVLKISMNTHSGDLREFPMLEKAELTVDDTIVKPNNWELLSKDSHHLNGVLTFPAKGADGNRIIQADSFVKLNIKDMREVSSRIFTWQLPIAQ